MPGQHNNTFERFGRYGSPTGLAKQGKVNLIRTIVTEREISDEHKARLEHALHRGVTNAKADEIITWLKRQPRVGSQPTLPVETTAPRERPTEDGFYLVDGEVFKVVWNKEGSRLYAKKTSPAGLVYVEGAMRKIFADQKMTIEEITAYGLQNAYCVICSHEFEDPTSKHIGIGPTCGPKMMGKDAYKALRLTVADRPDVIAFEAAKKERAKTARAAKKNEGVQEALIEA